MKALQVAIANLRDATKPIDAGDRVILLDEIEAMREMLTRIPQTPQQMIDFIGSNFNSQSPFDDDGKLCGDPSMVTYSLTVHDLLSAFSWADLDREAIDAARTQGGDA